MLMFDDQTKAFYTTMAHADFGDEQCCGCLYGVIDGEQGNIICNECSASVRTVPAAELEKTLTEMDLGLDLATVVCRHCRSVNLFPGFSQMHAFVCQQCGKPVSLSTQ
jgi:hypothetical protein